MTIVASPPPTKVQRLLRRHLRELAQVSASVVPLGEVQIAPGLAVYEADLSPVAGEPRPIGWRHIVLTKDGPIWADVSRDGVEGIFAGPQVVSLIEAARMAEASGGAGEARILIAPVLDAGALWIAGDEDQFWAFSPEPAPLEQTGAALLAGWAADAGALAAESDRALD